MERSKRAAHYSGDPVRTRKPCICAVFSPHALSRGNPVVHDCALGDQGGQLSLRGTLRPHAAAQREHKRLTCSFSLTSAGILADSGPLNRGSMLSMSLRNLSICAGTRCSHNPHSRPQHRAHTPSSSASQSPRRRRSVSMHKSAGRTRQGANATPPGPSAS